MCLCFMLPSFSVSPSVFVFPISPPICLFTLVPLSLHLFPAVSLFPFSLHVSPVLSLFVSSRYFLNFSFHLVRACLEFNTVVHSLRFVCVSACITSRCLPGSSATQSIQSFLSDASGCRVGPALAQHGAFVPPCCLHGLVQHENA